MTAGVTPAARERGSRRRGQPRGLAYGASSSVRLGEGKEAGWVHVHEERRRDRNEVAQHVQRDESANVRIRHPACGE